MGTDIQRTILLVIFGFSLFLLWDRWQVYNGRPAMFGTAPTPQQAAPAPTPATVVTATPPSSAGVPQVPSPAVPTPAAVDATPVSRASGVAPLVIQTDLLRASIDPLGAVVSRVELLQQAVAPDWTASGLIGLVTGKKHDPNATTVLLDVAPNRVYVAQSGIIGGDFPNHRTPFAFVGGPTELAPGQDRLDVRFSAESGGVRVIKTYTFYRGRYAADVKHEIVNLTDKPLAPSVYLQLTRDGNKPDGESALYYVYTGAALYTEQDKFRKVEFSEIEKNKAVLPKASDNGWIGMIQHYFVSAWVPPAGVNREYYARSVDKNLYSIGSIVALPSVAPNASATSQSTLYVGPQDQEVLASIAPGLDLVVDYGWLTVLAKPIYLLLAFLHGIVGNWGWAIVLLTVLIKAAFYPLSAASYKSMAKMKTVTPRMMKIREQYGDDKQKMNVAMMELYKTEKINPLGGCLPILVQIPVFIALYWVLLASVEMRNAPWILCVHDLATPDAWFILPVLMMATMWIQYKLNPKPPDPVQAKVMMLMPLIFGVMFFFFPAGLVLYWLTNNILSIAQQWYVTRQIENAKRPG
ncbi:MAG TPA: membrane protein insertase YidC [Burkholderiaceae bacterium]|nr:membrane protein insertase YidC [Burkholderiaceae bacterium]